MFSLAMHSCSPRQVARFRERSLAILVDRTITCVYVCATVARDFSTRPKIVRMEIEKKDVQQLDLISIYGLEALFYSFTAFGIRNFSSLSL